MKIVYVINSIKRSGPNQVLLNMISGLQNKEHTICVVTFFDGKNPDEVTKLEALGAKVTILDVAKNKISTLGAKKLQQLLGELKPDIVHSHGILSDIAVIRAGYKKKSVTTIHNNMFEDYLFTFGKFKGSIYIILHIAYLRQFARVVGCSSATASKLKTYVKNVVTIHNGIASNIKKDKKARNKIRIQLGIDETSKVYVYAGKLNSRKNILSLLSQFSESLEKDEHLIIIGDGEMTGECQEYASKTIHIVGFQSDVASYYQAADVYVSASNAEGFSISVIEALQYDLLLLLSNIPAHGEVFAINPLMYIGETFSKNGLSASKERLDFDKKQSAEYYKKYLTDTAMMNGYEKVYQEMVA